MASLLIRRALPSVFGILLLASSVAAQGVPRLDSYNGVAVRILQSNNAGNVHHIIDPTINKVVGLIRGCPHAHNLTVHPDGLYYYCANEDDDTVDVFDTKTLQARHSRFRCRGGPTRSSSTRSSGRSTRRSPNGPPRCSVRGSRRRLVARFPRSSM